MLAAWTDPGRFEPITEVMAGSGLDNSFRRQVDDSGRAPLARNHTHLDGSAGWGANGSTYVTGRISMGLSPRNFSRTRSGMRWAWRRSSSMSVGSSSGPGTSGIAA